MYLNSFFFSLLIPPPPRSTLFPYTTLFRSLVHPRLGPSGASTSPRIWIRSINGRKFSVKRKTQNVVDVFVLRSEEHTSELQSLRHLVCRLLLEKKNTARTGELYDVHCDFSN